jgi:hypothetical protein
VYGSERIDSKMVGIEYCPIAHNNAEFLEKVFKRERFADVYQKLAAGEGITRRDG